MVSGYRMRALFYSIPDGYLKCEPYVADELDVEEGFVRECPRLVECPVGGVREPILHGHVAYHGHSEVGVRLQTER